MRISGLEKCSFADYPGKLAAVVFLGGCNLNCSYCHNQDLLRQQPGLPEISRADLLGFLKSRRGILDAVVITGGEPALNPDLPGLLGAIREIGFLTKLDTNGTRPEMIQELIEGELVDYIAMDVKSPLPAYPGICRTMVDTGAIVRSIQLLIDSPVEYEFRTTVYPGMTEDDLTEIAQLIAGADRWYLQHYRAEGNDHLQTMPAVSEQNGLLNLQDIASKLSCYTCSCSTRGKQGLPGSGAYSGNGSPVDTGRVAGLDVPAILS